MPRRPIFPAVLAVLVVAAVATGCNGDDGNDGRTDVGAPTSVTVQPAAATVTTLLAPTISSSTSSTSSTTTTEPGLRRVTLAFSGDILVHERVWQSAEHYARDGSAPGYDFRPMFADIAPLLNSVDLAVCHLETVITDQPPSDYPFYAAPAEIVPAIKAAGYDNCSTASNHVFDKGAAGIDATLDAFDAVGLTQSGTARTKAEIVPRVLDVNGVRIAHLSYTYGYNGLEPPEGEWWRSAKIYSERIVNDAERARSMGAELVIVSMHWGKEPLSGIDRAQRLWADEITRGGLVDLVVGHHSHVVQGIEQVNGVWIVFGLGNHLSDHPRQDDYPAASQDGLLVTVQVDVHADGRVEVLPPVAHPTWVDRENGHVIRDVLAELRRDDLGDAARSVYAESLARTAAQVGSFIPTE